jgi:hypothetical protein
LFPISNFAARSCTYITLASQASPSRISRARKLTSKNSPPLKSLRVWTDLELPAEQRGVDDLLGIAGSFSTRAPLRDMGDMRWIKSKRLQNPTPSRTAPWLGTGGWVALYRRFPHVPPIMTAPGANHPWLQRHNPAVLTAGCSEQLGQGS